MMMGMGMWFLLMVVAMLVFVTSTAAARSRRQRSLPPHPGAQLTGYEPAGLSAPEISDASREALDRDITAYGDELRDLDLTVVGRELSAAAQADYTSALDRYEQAKQALHQARLESDTAAIAHVLDEGRYAIACVEARADGRAVPERRAPCFFDPAHGPSIRDVNWSPDGGVARQVPACALDAARIESGSAPSIRMVPQQGAMVPYWQDPRQSSWAQGYYQPYGQDPAVRGLAQGALMIGGFSLLFGMLDD
ncbi:MAG: hypothetical protein ACK5KO_08435 [Arachnia sp.]